MTSRGDQAIHTEPEGPGAVDTPTGEGLTGSGAVIGDPRGIPPHGSDPGKNPMRILLATDGKPAAAGAVRLATSLVGDLGATAEVLRVLQPVPIYGPGTLSPIPLEFEDLEASRRKAALTETRASVAEAGGNSSWPIRLVAGPPAPTIVRAANEIQASLILLGSGEHDRLQRWFGRETALRVMQISHIPVLAVPPAGGTRPATVVAAVDFSDFSRDALRMAVTLSRPGARIEAVHVIPEGPLDAPYLAEADWRRQLHERARAELEAWLDEEKGVQRENVSLHVLDGDPAQAVLTVAARTGAELICAGSHGLGFFGRVIFGSVSAALLRGSECALLVTPPRVPAPELTAAPLDTREAATP
jgi:nucleotide-binding universal stress UspA family protein